MTLFGNNSLGYLGLYHAEYDRAMREAQMQALQMRLSNSISLGNSGVAQVQEKTTPPQPKLNKLLLLTRTK